MYLYKTQNANNKKAVLLFDAYKPKIQNKDKVASRSLFVYDLTYLKLTTTILNQKILQLIQRFETCLSMQPFLPTH